MSNDKFLGSSDDRYGSFVPPSTISNEVQVKIRAIYHNTPKPYTAADSLEIYRQSVRIKQVVRFTHAVLNLASGMSESTCIELDNSGMVEEHEIPDPKYFTIGDRVKSTAFQTGIKHGTDDALGVLALNQRMNISYFSAWTRSLLPYVSSKGFEYTRVHAHEDDAGSMILQAQTRLEPIVVQYRYQADRKVPNQTICLKEELS